MFKKREHVPRGPKLNGDQEAKIIALRLGSPPKGFSNWSLRLLQSTVVELSIVDSVSPETLRRSLKKWHDSTQNPILGHASPSQRRVCCADGKCAPNLRNAVQQPFSGAFHGRATSATSGVSQYPDRSNQKARQTNRLRIQTSRYSKSIHVCRTANSMEKR